MATSLQRPCFPVPTSDPFTQILLLKTSPQRPPLYNGQKILSEGGRCRKVRLYSVIDINNNIKEILAIFRRFPNIFRRISKILGRLSEVHTNISDHFPKMCEDVQRFLEVAEGCRIFPSNLRRCFDHIEINLGSFNN